MRHHLVKSVSKAIAAMTLLITVAQADDLPNGSPRTIRIATYNASLYGKSAGQIAERMKTGKDRQGQSIAAIIQTVRPDILLINEIDYEPEATTAKQLRDLYFAKGTADREGIDYPFVYSAPSNTGVPSGLDLNADGIVEGPNDAWGYGVYPGQYAFAVFSRFPIDTDSIRTFQNFAWSKLPDALRPIAPGAPESFYNDETWNALRLSSKNHVDVPILIDGRKLHVLASHPTPPVFDGPEDRNGCRNHDEIAFWIHYIENRPALVDDSGASGGLSPQSSFVIMGDLNSDPISGEGRREAIQALLGHPRVIDPQPRRLSSTETTPPEEANDTANFGRVGELRADYVLPSRDLKVSLSQVFWPANGEKGSDWIHASDHRLVWIDAILPVAEGDE